jgi:two-component system, cell cycle sensor histidine kinase and response regulator CckA
MGSRLRQRVLERVRWSGPFLTDHSEVGHRAAMARASAYLYAAGAALGLASLGLPSGPGQEDGVIALVALAALAIGLLHLIVFDRLPDVFFQFSGLAAIGLIAVGVHAGGEAAGAYLVFLFWPVMFAAFFYRPIGAALQLTAAAVALEVLAALPGAEVLQVHVFTTVGTLALAAGIVMLLKNRVRSLVGGLREAEARYRTLVEHLPLATYIDALDGTTMYIGPQIEDMLGYPRETWLERPDFFVELLHPEDREAVLAETTRSREAGEPFRAEYRFISARGKPVWVLDVTVDVCDEQGRRFARQGFFVDMTERRRAHQERRRLESELRQSQKMESVGRLAGGIAHDFNNLLMAIGGYTNLAISRLEGGENGVAEDLSEIQRAADRAASLTRQLLAYSRKQLLQPVELDLNAVLRELEPMLTRLIGEHVEVVTALDAGRPHVEFDRGQLEQIVVNLAINARDAMPGGGTLRIRTAEHADGVDLVVTDDGCGIAPELHERIFEPFFTTKEPGKGTGLGLSTVDGIVSQSGGAIFVESVPGGGASFRVQLPRATNGHVVLASEGSTNGGSGTILLVEDEELVRRPVTEMLRRAGYEVLSAAEPQEALDLARAFPGSIDLLLTDVVMPSMSGRELAGRLLAERPATRLVYMSGYTDDAIADQGVLASGTIFLQKPFTHEQLSEKVAEVLAA